MTRPFGSIRCRSRRGCSRLLLSALRLACEGLEVFAPVVADNCNMEVRAACLWARLALVEVVANEMRCADERPAKREDLEVVRRWAVGRGWYDRSTMAGITAHDSWGSRIVEACPARVDQRTRRQSLSSRCRRNPERDSRDQERQPDH